MIEKNAFNMLKETSLNTTSKNKKYFSNIEYSIYHFKQLEHLRVQWAKGNFGYCANINISEIVLNTYRSKIALIIGCSNLRTDNVASAKIYITLAYLWGCRQECIVAFISKEPYCYLAHAMNANSLWQMSKEYLFLATHDSNFKYTHNTYKQNSRELIHFRYSEYNSKYQIQRKNNLQVDILELELYKSVMQLLLNKKIKNFIHDRKSYKKEISSKNINFKNYFTIESVSNLFHNPGRIPYCILLECKSLPRSGLHYMKETFSKQLKENFSFCEWYQQPKCCRNMPCSTHSYNGCNYYLKLLKSHDFEFSDPLSILSKYMRRVILFRHPLFALTSYYSLAFLAKNKNLLKENNIHINEIYLLHNPIQLANAYKILEMNTSSLVHLDTEKWLAGTIKYFSSFIKKWLLINRQLGSISTYYVNYENINDFIYKFTKDELLFSKNNKHETEVFHKESAYAPREDPFTDKYSGFITKILNNDRSLFERAAETVIQVDKSDILSSLYKIDGKSYFKKSNTYLYM